MDKTQIDKKHIENDTRDGEKRPTRRLVSGQKARPNADDVVRTEHERHKVLMDLLAK